MGDSPANILATLLTVIDPVGNAPLFVALTAGMSAGERRRVAFRAAGVGLGVLAVFALAGEAVLGVIGISMPAFRIAGGLLLFLIAVDMLFEKRTARREARVEAEQTSAEDPSVFPLAIPLIAGPGAIAAVILLMGAQEGSLAGQAMVIGMMAGVIGAQVLLFLAGGLIERALGRTGVMVVTRLLGILLAGLAVQFVLDGAANAGLGRVAGGGDG